MCLRVRSTDRSGSSTDSLVELADASIRTQVIFIKLARERRATAGIITMVVTELTRSVTREAFTSRHGLRDRTTASMAREMIRIRTLHCGADPKSGSRGDHLWLI